MIKYELCEKACIFWNTPTKDERKYYTWVFSRRSSLNYRLPKLVTHIRIFLVEYRKYHPKMHEKLREFVKRREDYGVPAPSHRSTYLDWFVDLFRIIAKMSITLRRSMHGRTRLKLFLPSLKLGTIKRNCIRSANAWEKNSTIGYCVELLRKDLIIRNKKKNNKKWELYRRARKKNGITRIWPPKEKRYSKNSFYFIWDTLYPDSPRKEFSELLNKNNARPIRFSVFRFSKLVIPLRSIKNNLLSRETLAHVAFHMGTSELILCAVRIQNVHLFHANA